MAQYAKTDNFGRQYVLKSTKPAVNRKSGETFEHIGETFMEFGGQLYKITVSPAQKDGRNYWVKATKLVKRSSYSRGGGRF